jgi:2-dehydro-3-deoxyphosphooctonate aldolase (KDO 8-P synthase)
MPKAKPRAVRVGDVVFSNDAPLGFISGPCAMESEQLLMKTGRGLKEIFGKIRQPFILKCSADKANRTSIKSYRGPGFEEGLHIFARVKKALRVPILTDVHEAWQAPLAAEVCDVLQIPAFLCRQTDLLIACGKTGKPINIKKGQFLAPWDLKNAVQKIESTGNRNIMVCERGTTFGYGNLIVDMRSFEIMREWGYPVIYDVTHSVQLPGGLGSATDGQRHFAAPLGRGAVAVGVAGLFFETHPNPPKALSDGPNSMFLRDVPAFLSSVRTIDSVVKRGQS